MTDRSENIVWKCAAGLVMSVLILLGPVLALLAMGAAEMLADVLRMAGAPAVGAMAAGVIGWLLVLKYRPEARGRPVDAEGD
jgi:hypothetical protein